MKKQSQLARRELLRKAGMAVGLGAISIPLQNCGVKNGIDFKQTKNETSASNCAPVDPLIPDVLPDDRSLDDNRNKIGDLPVYEVTPGDEKDVQAKCFSMDHYRYSDPDSAAINDATSYILLVGAGPNPLNAVAPVYAKMLFSAAGSFGGASELLLYKVGETQPRYRRILSAGDLIPETMFVLDDSTLLNSEAYIVVKYGQAYYRRKITLAPQPYSDFINAKTNNPSVPFGGVSSVTRPFIAGRGLATGNQGDLGSLHAPLIRVFEKDINVIMGGKANRHGRFAENHYIGGAALFDQNGHALGPISNIIYGSNHSSTDAGYLASHGFMGLPNDVSETTFKNVDLVDRGVRVVRAVMFDTAQGYIMSLQKVA